MNYSIYSNSVLNNNFEKTEKTLFKLNPAFSEVAVCNEFFNRENNDTFLKILFNFTGINHGF